MFATTVFLSLLLVMFIGMAILWCLLLRLGLQWAKVPDANTRHIILAFAVTYALNLAMTIISEYVPTTSPGELFLLLAVQLVLTLAIAGFVIGGAFKTSFARALQAWLPTLLAPVLFLLISIFVIRPLLYEAYDIPTNAMAPTLLGEHVRGTCATCDQPCFCSPTDVRFPPGSKPWLTICENFHINQTKVIDQQVYSGDKLLVAKFHEPRRWDIIVFRNPEEPNILYVKRLVGLPGEKVFIHENHVWIDGKKLVPPEELRGITYLAELPFAHGTILWGSKSDPVTLEDDEYFVLGDFSAASMDSRLWRKGAFGHNPYAVPESHIIGVATHIFWPFERWRILK